MGKPDPAAFRRMFAVLAVEPPEVCVIGDSLDWDVRPSQALGGVTILYDPETREGFGRRSGGADTGAGALASLQTHLPGPQSRPGSE